MTKIIEYGLLFCKGHLSNTSIHFFLQFFDLIIQQKCFLQKFIENLGLHLSLNPLSLSLILSLPSLSLSLSSFLTLFLPFSLFLPLYIYLSLFLPLYLSLYFYLFISLFLPLHTQIRAQFFLFFESTIRFDSKFRRLFELVLNVHLRTLSS